MEEKYSILKIELENEIFLKLKKIEEKVLTQSTGIITKDIQILTLASEELDDVLLNWEEFLISAVNFNPLDDFELDD